MRLLLLLTPCILFAQVQELATTGDGGVVYFTTVLRQKGTTQSADQKLFAMDTSGLRLVAAEDPGPITGNTTANFYIMNNPEVSADGSVLGYTANRLCYGGSSCLAVQTSMALIGERKMTGRVTLSRNGRYAFNYGANWFASPVQGGSFLIDLQTGETVRLAANLGVIMHRAVGNDGSVLFVQGDAFVYWKAGVSRELAVAEPAGSDGAPILYRMNDAGTKFAYIGRSRTLWFVDLVNGGQLALAKDVTGVPFGISGDLSRIVFAKAVDGVAQVMMWDGGVTKQISTLLERVAEVTLSDDGRIAYVATVDGRLLQFDIASGWMDERISRTPAVAGVQGPSAPGSAALMLGSGLKDVHVRMNGAEVTVLSATADRLWFRVPQDAPLGNVTISLAPGESLLETGDRTLELLPFAPAFVPGNDPTIYYLPALHEDLQSLVTPERPAAAGEAIHIWMTGLGPLDSRSPARITTPMSCTFGSGTPGELLYAGEAPGLPGFYQIDVRVPGGLTYGQSSLQCGTAGGRTAFGLVPVVTSN